MRFSRFNPITARFNASPVAAAPLPRRHSDTEDAGLEILQVLTEKAVDKVDKKGRPVFTSPYLHERGRPLKVVKVELGGATGPVPAAFAAAVAAGTAPNISDVPIPTPRPPYPAAADEAPAQPSGGGVKAKEPAKAAQVAG